MRVDPSTLTPAAGWIAAYAQNSLEVLRYGGLETGEQPAPHLHIAERVAMLNVLSNGRVEFGTGRGATASELDGYGVATGDSRGMWEEVLHQVPRMWAEGAYPGYHGNYVTLPSREIRPKPA